MSEDLYKQPDYVTKRLRYFDGQFLSVTDFIDEQKYHIDRQRRLARFLHISGVLNGLVVEKEGTSIKIKPGTAIDQQGRQILVPEVITIAENDIKTSSGVALAQNQSLFLVLTYAEIKIDEQQEVGAKDSTRFEEKAEVTWMTDNDAKNAEGVQIAKVTKNASGAISVDLSVCQYSGLKVKGNVGIGTLSPTAKLEVVQNGTGSVAYFEGSEKTTSDALYVEQNGTGNAAYFKGGSGVKIEGNLEVIGTTNLSPSLTANNNNATLTALKISPSFQENGKTGVKQYGLIVESGNVGIGTTNPTEKLEVNGDIKVSGQVYIDNYAANQSTIWEISVQAASAYEIPDELAAANDMYDKTELIAPPPILNIVGETNNLFGDSTRGLNTIIIGCSGIKKRGFDTYNDGVSQANIAWSNWADWINSNANDEDIVITASQDALRNAPDENNNSATQLLKRIKAKEAFDVENKNLNSVNRYRSAYILIFIKGQDTCKETSKKYTTSIELYNQDVLATLVVKYNELIKKQLLNYALVSQENGLRLVRGSINSNGYVNVGKGFYVLKHNQGEYAIYFMTGFSTTPTVVATQHYSGNNNWGDNTKDNCVVTYVTVSQCRIICGNGDGNKADRDFEFIAVG